MPGGNTPPVLKGDSHPFIKYSDETIFNIQYDLKYSTKSLKELSEEYDISVDYLRMLNSGFARRNTYY